MNKDEYIKIRISKKDKERLKNLSNKENESLSSFIIRKSLSQETVSSHSYFLPFCERHQCVMKHVGVLSLFYSYFLLILFLYKTVISSTATGSYCKELQNLNHPYK